MGYICGWVVLFRMILAFFDRWFLWLFPAAVRVGIYGVLELANGCCALLMIENEGLMFATAWTERQTPVMSLGTDDCRGSSLMFDFGGPFLDIMKNGGKTVLFVYDENVDDYVDETWTLKDDKYVCDSKPLSYTLEEFVAYMDKEECDNVDVFLGGELKINICNIDCFI